MKLRKKGSLAVTFTLFFLSFLLAVGTMTEVTSGVCAASMGKSVMDLAGRSVLAEYDKGLLNEYGLFGVRLDNGEMEDRFRYYGDQGMGCNKGIVHLKLSEIHGDCDGLTLTCPDRLEEQIAAHMKLRVVLDLWKEKDILNQLGAFQEGQKALESTKLLKAGAAFLSASRKVEKQVAQVKGEWEASDQGPDAWEAALQKLESMDRVLEEARQKEIEYWNVAEMVDGGTMEKGMSQAVKVKAAWMETLVHCRQSDSNQLFSQCGEESSSAEGEKKWNSIRIPNPEDTDGDEPQQPDVVLRNSAVLSELPTVQMGISQNRLPNLSLSTLGEGGFLKGIGTMFYVNSYILSLFHHRLSKRDGETKESLFQNEAEYILFGSYSDQTNGRRAKRALFLLRTGFNLAHIYSDSEKRDQIMTLAESILPGGAGLALQGILAGIWAGIEAENDVRLLVGGERVALWKNKEQWALPLSRIFSASGGAAVTPQKEGGSSYEDYLSLFLYGMDRQVKLVRIMDLIQLNLQGRWDRSFSLAQCSAGVHYQAVLNKRSGFPGVFPLGERKHSLETTQMY